MKALLIALLTLGSIGVVTQELSKVQPKELVLGKDSQSDKYGEVPFNHETHATKKYSIDGQSVLTCVECHHTDQPAASLKPPLKTSEREAVLTTEALAAADAKGVKKCRGCHLQAGDDSVTVKGKNQNSIVLPKIINQESKKRQVKIPCIPSSLVVNGSTSKSSFVINTNANTALTGDVDWQAVVTGESN